MERRLPEEGGGRRAVPTLTQVGRSTVWKSDGQRGIRSLQERVRAVLRRVPAYPGLPLLLDYAHRQDGGFSRESGMGYSSPLTASTGASSPHGIGGGTIPYTAQLQSARVDVTQHRAQLRSRLTTRGGFALLGVVCQTWRGTPNLSPRRRRATPPRGGRAPPSRQGLPRYGVADSRGLFVLASYPSNSIESRGGSRRESRLDLKLHPSCREKNCVCHSVAMRPAGLVSLRLGTVAVY